MASVIDIASLWNDCLSSLSSSSSSVESTLEAWTTATTFLAPRSIEASVGEVQPDPEVVEAVKILQERGMIQDLLQWHTGKASLDALHPRPTNLKV